MVWPNCCDRSDGDREFLKQGDTNRNLSPPLSLSLLSEELSFLLKAFCRAFVAAEAEILCFKHIWVSSLKVGSWLIRLMWWFWRLDLGFLDFLIDLRSADMTGVVCLLVQSNGPTECYLMLAPLMMITITWDRKTSQTRLNNQLNLTLSDWTYQNILCLTQRYNSLN